jgi:5,5'-dehydrodivanillate O-demethylase oxygenase subunit
MMTEQENDRLTRVGKGTPMGELLRRYWHPVATTPDLEKDPVRRVRLLGENLTLFRTTSGELGLVGERCPHRGVDLQYGIPEKDGLRCPYHGWKVDKTGRCLEMPFDDRLRDDMRHRERIGTNGYPVEELGGLIWAYLGPKPAPLLPRWDLLVREEFDRAAQIHVLPCNWLQCMENSADPVHFEFLHATFGNYMRKKEGKPPAMKVKRHLKIAFDRFKYGLMKRRLLEGEPETSDDWTVGHPLLFPCTLAQGAQDAPTLQIRVPIDDTHTLHYLYRAELRKPGTAPTGIQVLHESLYGDDGKIMTDQVVAQDFVAWIAQGPISDRSHEHLAASDTGITVYRRLLNEALEAVARGEDPMGVIRDRAENEPWIELHREAETLKGFDSKYQALQERIREMAGATE